MTPVALAASVHDDGYAAWLTRMRKDKDQAFRAEPWSPVPHAERRTFAGLAYYAPDPRYRQAVVLEEAETERLEVPLSTGGTRTYTRVARIRLPLPEGEAVLAAYETEGAGDGSLFVPFRDGTSGKETYGAGRYLEVHPTDDGRWLVDFNLAYNPYCAYSEEYACPLPPAENWLRIPVRAGERHPAK